jgi:hypothetical protein
MSNISIKYCELSLCTKVSSLVENYDVEIVVLGIFTNVVLSHHITLKMESISVCFSPMPNLESFLEMI